MSDDQVLHELTQCEHADGHVETGAAPVDRLFAADVESGLRCCRKSLPCVYFYDDRGSRLFEDITALPEYYLTRAEAEIIARRSGDIAALAPDPVQVVELGSGTSVKTATLLETMLGVKERVVYVPVDVCEGVLEETSSTLREAMPGLAVHPLAARYEDGLAQLDREHGGVLLLWLGSSIGNLTREHAAYFLAGLRAGLSQDDRFLLGVDLVKDAGVLEAAYDDRAGVTAEFNLNLLTRINRELGGDFDLSQFRHVAVWNAEEGRIEMYLESLREQTVSISALGTSVEFEAGERIHTEHSHKYTLEQIETLAASAGMRITDQWLDSRGLFSLNMLSRSSPPADGRA
ncbi:MAG TPA: L-histidine N(alpha)-methyltransferase [bacterium]|nr:L-histidine N(alpha)-methyltransferase [bacterium]